MKSNKLFGKKFVTLGAMLSLMLMVFPANARVAGTSVETNDLVDTAVAAGQFKRSPRLWKLPG